MNRRRFLLLLAAVLIFDAVIALGVAIVVWPQPGEVKALAVAVVSLVSAIAALIGSAP